MTSPSDQRREVTLVPCRACKRQWLPDRLDETGRCFGCEQDGVDSPEQYEAFDRLEEARADLDDARMVLVHAESDVRKFEEKCQALGMEV